MDPHVAIGSDLSFSRYEPVQIFERRARWWREPATDHFGNHDTPPSPMAEAIAFDSEGLLWVFLTVGRDSWKAAWSRVSEGVREVRAGAIDIDFLLMARIEVNDFEHGRVVARADVPRRFRIASSRRALRLPYRDCGRPSATGKSRRCHFSGAERTGRSAHGPRAFTPDQA